MTSSVKFRELAAFQPPKQSLPHWQSAKGYQSSCLLTSLPSYLLDDGPRAQRMANRPPFFRRKELQIRPVMTATTVRYQSNRVPTVDSIKSITSQLTKLPLLGSGCIQFRALDRQLDPQTLIGTGLPLLQSSSHAPPMIKSTLSSAATT